jgi:hypothetical protein
MVSIVLIHVCKTTPKSYQRNYYNYIYTITHILEKTCDGLFISQHPFYQILSLILKRNMQLFVIVEKHFLMPHHISTLLI